MASLPVPVDAATRANAEPMVRGDPDITLRPFGPRELAGIDVTVAIGAEPLDPIRAAAEQSAEWTGRAPLVLAGGHEVYRSDVAVLTDALAIGTGRPMKRGT